MHFTDNNINIMLSARTIFDVKSIVNTLWHKFDIMSKSNHPNISKHATIDAINIIVENIINVILSKTFILILHFFLF